MTTPSDTEAVPVEITVLGARVRGVATVPCGVVAVEELLRVFRMVADAVVAVSGRAVRGVGKEISCRAGCGACCRQPVPVSVAEARRIAALVEELPEPRRSEVRARFAAIEERVAAAGLMQAFMEPEAADPAVLPGAPMAYFRLGMACPFLVDESCGIYEERPLVCREYIVTSPAVHCAAPDERVEVVAMPVKASEALARLEGTEGRRYVRQVPLGLALKVARESAGASETRRAAEVVAEFVRLLEMTRR